ncbi:MAG: cytochrome c [Flavobacteriaceae bacterium]|nr:cytochrome c [Flavobacteriaceae bacterium]
MKGLIKTVVLVMLVSMVVSCKSNDKPNYQFFPNMYESPSYETYGEYDIFSDEQSALLPAEGTLARGHSFFEYKNTNEDYERAKAELTNPLEESEINLEKGKELYTIYCAICHGNNGDGQGTLVKREKILGIPNYADREITEGSIYHVIYYGKNAMGSHANFLNEEERWQVIAYVQKLRSELTK